MKYRNNKDLVFSEIGLGCYGLGGSYGPVDVDRYKDMLRRGYDLGVNFFDTAEGYGEAEKILGEVVKPFRHRVLIATKVGVKDGFRPDLSPDYIQDACERSLQALGVETIDLYQVHFDDPSTPVAETVVGLERLVSQGKIRNYGLGHLPALRVWEYLRIGNVYSAMMELSAVSRDALQELLPFCRENDLAAIAFSVTGRGLLTGSISSNDHFHAGDIRRIDPLFQGVTFEAGLRTAQILADIGSKYGKSAAQTAIAWVLAQPGITCALTGPSTIPHLEENLGGSGWEIDQGELARLDSYFEYEETRLVQEQGKAVINIISEPLSQNPNQALIDLVFACENAIKLKMISEQEMMPVFLQLIELRENLDDRARRNLVEIQSQLVDLIHAKD